jgi:hypothetical protein
VEAVGIVNRLPMGGQAQSNGNHPRASAGYAVMIDSRSVNGDYFRSLAVPACS